MIQVSGKMIQVGGKVIQDDPDWRGYVPGKQSDMFYSVRVEALIRNYRRAVPQGISEDEVEICREEFIKQRKEWLKAIPGVCSKI